MSLISYYRDLSRVCVTPFCLTLGHLSDRDHLRCDLAYLRCDLAYLQCDLAYLQCDLAYLQCDLAN